MKSMLPEPPLPAATAGPLCCFWAPDFSSPDSHTWALRLPANWENLWGEKGQKNLGKDPPPFVCLQHRCCHIIVNNLHQSAFWNCMLRTMESYDITLCYAQGPIVFHFNSHPLYAYQNQILNPNPYFHLQSLIIQHQYCWWFRKLSKLTSWGW